MQNNISQQHFNKTSPSFLQFFQSLVMLPWPLILFPFFQLHVLPHSFQQHSTLHPTASLPLKLSRVYPGWSLDGTPDVAGCGEIKSAEKTISRGDFFFPQVKNVHVKLHTCLKTTSDMWFTFFKCDIFHMWFVHTCAFKNVFFVMVVGIKKMYEIVFPYYYALWMPFLLSLRRCFASSNVIQFYLDGISFLSTDNLTTGLKAYKANQVWVASRPCKLCVENKITLHGTLYMARFICRISVYIGLI